MQQLWSSDFDFQFSSCSTIGQHPKKDLALNGNRTGKARQQKYFCIPVFILRSTGERLLLNLAKPAQNLYFFWRFFFKFSKNLPQNTPFKILFFPFWRNFASKKKEKKPLLWKALKKKARQDETQFTTKTGGKNQFGSQLFCFVKFSFPVTHSMPYYAETGRSHPAITRLSG